MKYLKSFNESLRDKMVPKSEDNIRESLDKMNPFKAMAMIRKHNLTDITEHYREKAKPIIDKLYKDIEKFDRKNIGKFIDFINEWIDEQQYGASHQIDLSEKFGYLGYDFGYNEEEDEEMYDEEEVDEFDEEAHRRAANSKKQNLFTDKTIELFKQMVVSYTIDKLSNVVYERDRDDDDGDEDGWGDDEIEMDEPRRLFARGEDEQDSTIDDYIDEIADEISDDYDVNIPDLMSLLNGEYYDDVEEAFETGVPSHDCMVHLLNVKKLEEWLEKMEND
jgi:hypothetical protein